MAKLRSVNTGFWDDEYIGNLSRDERFAFLYFLTNPLVNMAGAYKISRKTIKSHTGFTDEELDRLVVKFEADGKVICHDGWVVLLNFLKNQNLSANMRKGVIANIADAPDWVAKTVVACIRKSRILSKDFADHEFFLSEVESLETVVEPLSTKKFALSESEREREVEREEEEGISSEMPPAPITVPDRKDHPVILTLKEVTGLYPPKEIWDNLIDLLAHDLDAVRLKQCFTKWRARGFSKINYDWAMDWYINGIPKQGKGETNGNYRQQRERQAIDENAIIVGIRAKRNAERAAEQLQRGGTADSSRQLCGVVAESDLAGEVGSGRSLGPPALPPDPRNPLAGVVR